MKSEKSLADLLGGEDRTATLTNFLSPSAQRELGLAIQSYLEMERAAVDADVSTSVALLPGLLRSLVGSRLG